MKKTVVKIGFCTILLLSSCQKKADSMSASELSEAPVSEGNLESRESELDSKALTQTPTDKKFKKQVAVSLDVKNAYDTTLFIEEEVVKNGGYILKSKIENLVQMEKVVPISADSVKKYTKTLALDSIICKVPEQKVSEFLKSLEGKYTKLNLRDISLEDVTQEYILGDKQNKASQNFSGKIEKELKGSGKLGEKVEAIQTLKNYEEEKNNNQYSQAKLDNDVKYATIEIELKEPEKYTVQTLVNTSKYDNADSPFWFRIKESFVNGYQLLRWLLIKLVSIWPIVIIGSLVLLVYKKRPKNNN